MPRPGRGAAKPAPSMPRPRREKAESAPASRPRHDAAGPAPSVSRPRHDTAGSAPSKPRPGTSASWMDQDASFDDFGTEAETPASFGLSGAAAEAGMSYNSRPTVPETRFSEAEFSAVAPRKMTKGECSVIDIVMYEPEYRKIVDRLIREAEGEVQEKRSGIHEIEKGSRIRIELTSPDLELEDCIEEGTWRGKYLAFSFPVYVPEDYKKRQIMMTARVYVDEIPLTRLHFAVRCFSFLEQKLRIVREDVLSAFVSYASKDRERVVSRLQGMMKVRPEMDLFFDVESLRSGEDWEQALHAEIDRRDVLFLFWSQAAKESEWVEREWRYALRKKGPEGIEPVPIDPPDVCPPPAELSAKHFNDRYLFLINKN